MSSPDFSLLNFSPKLAVASTYAILLACMPITLMMQNILPSG